MGLADWAANSAVRRIVSSVRILAGEKGFGFGSMDDGRRDCPKRENGRIDMRQLAGENDCDIDHADRLGTSERQFDESSMLVVHQARERRCPPASHPAS